MVTFQHRSKFSRKKAKLGDDLVYYLKITVKVLIFLCEIHRGKKAVSGGADRE